MPYGTQYSYDEAQLALERLSTVCLVCSPYFMHMYMYMHLNSLSEMYMKKTL